jgi:hypothetical protein
MAVTLNANSSTGFIATSDTSGVLQLQTGGTTAVTVDASQNVGVNATPSAWGSTAKAVQLPNGCAIANLGAGDVVVTQNAYFDNPNFKYTSTTGVGSSVYRQIDGTHRWSYSASGTAGNNITFTEAMRIDSSGNVGIGTASPAALLDVDKSQNGTTGLRLGNTNAGSSANARVLIVSDGGNIQIKAVSSANTTYGNADAGVINCDTMSGGLLFAHNDSVKMTLDSSGNLLVAKTSTAANLVGAALLATGESFYSMASSSNGVSTLNVFSTTLSQYQFYVSMAGIVYARTTTISGLSDARLKENIRDLDDGLNTVMALQPRKFDWKEGKGADIKNARGFIAQEFETVLPDLIDEWKDPAPEGEDPYKSVRADLIPVLVKAIQEQQALITQLQADVAALKGASA